MDPYLDLKSLYAGSTMSLDRDDILNPPQVNCKK